MLSVPTDLKDRVLVTLVPHTTSVQGTRFEVPAKAKFLHGGGVFDAQQIAMVPQVKLVRKLGDLPKTSWHVLRRRFSTGWACKWSGSDFFPRRYSQVDQHLAWSIAVSFRWPSRTVFQITLARCLRVPYW